MKFVCATDDLAQAVNQRLSDATPGFADADIPTLPEMCATPAVHGVIDR